MNDILQQKLSSIESLIATQRDCVAGSGAATSYMHGMANGMILCYAILDNSRPRFMERPKKAYNRNVRHKCVKSRRNR